MSLDVQLTCDGEDGPDEVYWANITHNLRDMATEAGMYHHLWRPDEMGFTKAAEITPGLRAGLALLLAEPKKYRAFDSPNGWGTYDTFVRFVQEYLAACEEHPDATVSVSR